MTDKPDNATPSDSSDDLRPSEQANAKKFEFDENGNLRGFFFASEVDVFLEFTDKAIDLTGSERGT